MLEPSRRNEILRWLYDHPVHIAASFTGAGLVRGFLYKTMFTLFYFDYTVVLMLIEAVVTLVFVEILRYCKIAPVSSYTLDRGREMLLPSVCYCMYTLFSLNAMAGMNLPMYTTLKRLVPIINLYLVWSYHKKGWPNKGIGLAVLLITVGGFMGDLTDMTFDMWAYFYGFLSVLSQCICFNMIQRLASTGQGFNPYDQIYLNAFNLIFLLLVLDFFDDEIRDSVIYFMTSASDLFYLILFFVIVVSVWNQFAMFRCAACTSALTTSVADSGRATIDVLVGFSFSLTYFNDVVFTGFNVFGAAICVTGILMYVYSRANELRAASMFRR